jgi:hypothetical protein
MTVDKKLSTRSIIKPLNALNYKPKSNLSLLKAPPLDEFLNQDGETIVDEDSNIFASVVDYYSIDKGGEESDKSDTEEPRVPIAKAFKACETPKLWKL